MQDTSKFKITEKEKALLQKFADMNIDALSEAELKGYVPTLGSWTVSEDAREYLGLLQVFARLAYLENYEEYCRFMAEHREFLMEVIGECPAATGLVLAGLKQGVADESGICMNELGALYYNGSLVDQDYEAAATLYEMAGSAGCVQGWINLGYIYEYGRMAEPDYQKAHECYALAAAVEPSSEACYKLGDMYNRQGPLKKDKRKVFALYSRSLELAEGPAQMAHPALRLAEIYMRGDAEDFGVDTDILTALHFYQIAEFGLRIEIKNGLSYYKKRLKAAVEGQEHARDLLDHADDLMPLD